MGEVGAALLPPGAEWLAHAVRDHGDRPAVEFEGRVLDWNALAARVAGTTRWLEEMHLGAGCVVAVLAENSLLWPRWLHALAARGAALLALNLRSTADELVFQLRDARARVLVAGPGADADRVDAIARACEALCIAFADDDGAVTRVAGPTPPAAARADASGFESAATVAPMAPLAILYTSGTTGRPKGVALPARAFAASARGSEALVPLGPRDRWLVCMPLFHVGGLSILVRTALSGATAVIQRRFDPSAVARAVDETGITHASFVATMLAGVLDARAEAPRPTDLRCVLLGGGPAPAGLVERAWRLGWPVSPTYGLTEACSQVATRRMGDRVGPAAGRLCPLPGLDVCVRDALGARRFGRTEGEFAVGGAGTAEGRILVRGTNVAEGEILVRGASVAAGYVGHASGQPMVDGEGWLATGDVGRIDASGTLEVLDRRDDLIVSGGENVYPAEVEAVLLEHPAVSEAAVVARPDPHFGARPVAYWVRRAQPRSEASVAAPEAPAAPNAPSLEDHVRSRLAGFKVPVAFIEVGSLPRTATGKLQRARLRPIADSRLR